MVPLVCPTWAATQKYLPKSRLTSTNLFPTGFNISRWPSRNGGEKIIPQRKISGIQNPRKQRRSGFALADSHSGKNKGGKLLARPIAPGNKEGNFTGRNKNKTIFRPKLKKSPALTKTANRRLLPRPKGEGQSKTRDGPQTL